MTGTLVAGTAVVAPSDSSSSANDTISGLQILEDANGLPAAQTGIIIAGDNYGSLSSNAAAIDIFPNGTVPWSQAGLIFEDLATQNNSAIILGRGTDPASQGISFISGSFANFPLVSHLYANNGEILMPSEAGMIPGIYTPSLGCGNNLNGSSECYFDAEGRADFGYLHGNAFIQAGPGHYIDFDWNEASGPSASAKAWFDNGSTSLTMNQLHIDAITSPANGTVTFFNPGSYPFTGTSIGLAPNATGAGQIVQAVPAGTNCSNTYECVVVQLVHGATLGASNSETFGFSTGSGSPSQLLSIFGNGDVTIGNSGVDGGSKLYDDGSFSALSANITGLGSSTLPLCTTTGGRITNSGCALGTSPTIVSPTITGAVTFSGGSISTGGTLNFSGLKGNYIASSNNGSVSGCSLTASTGGGSAGKFVSGTSGTCTVTVTSSVTVANGYACWANDITTPADTLHQTAYTTTTSTISGTTVSGDVIVWGCLAF